jgi:hypothetical protein
MSMLRKLGALLCALVVLSLPVVGGAALGGDGGLVNLPGGGGKTQKCVRSSCEDLTMVLPPNMWGAVAVITGMPKGGMVTMPTNNGRFTLTALAMQELIAAGATRLTIMFVLPGLPSLTVYVELDPTARTVTLIVN